MNIWILTNTCRDLQGNPLTNPRSLNIQLQKAGVSVITSLLSDLPVDYCRVNRRGVLDFSKVAALHGRPTEEIIPCIEFCFDFLYDSKVFPIEMYSFFYSYILI